MQNPQNEMAKRQSIRPGRDRKSKTQSMVVMHRITNKTSAGHLDVRNKNKRLIKEIQKDARINAIKSES